MEHVRVVLLFILATKCFACASNIKYYSLDKENFSGRPVGLIVEVHIFQGISQKTIAYNYDAVPYHTGDTCLISCEQASKKYTLAWNQQADNTSIIFPSYEAKRITINLTLDRFDHDTVFKCTAFQDGSLKKSVGNISIKFVNTQKESRLEPDFDLSPCGPNAIYHERDEVVVCSCLEGYQGDPYMGCRPECVLDSDCSADKSCIKNKCSDPCLELFLCGINAECSVINHIPYCACINGYSGDPYIDCAPIAKDPVATKPCQSSPCGPNSICRDNGGTASCECLANYIGAPPHCRPECIASSDCPVDRACYKLKCVDPCRGICGASAICSVINHLPFCTCPPSTSGDPFILCSEIKDSSQSYHGNFTVNPQCSDQGALYAIIDEKLHKYNGAVKHQNNTTEVCIHTDRYFTNDSDVFIRRHVTYMNNPKHGTKQGTIVTPIQPNVSTNDVQTPAIETEQSSTTEKIGCSETTTILIVIFVTMVLTSILNSVIFIGCSETTTILIVIIVTMVLTSILNSVIFIVLVQRRFNKTRVVDQGLPNPTVDEPHYETVDSCNDVSQRAPCPLPAEELEENKKYVHYDTPYEWRIWRFGVNPYRRAQPPPRRPGSQDIQ